MERLKVAIVCAVLVLVSSTASAQMIKMPEWTEKGFVNINGAAQATGQDINNTLLFDQYGESASLEASRRASGGLFFDAMAGVRLKKNIGVGANFSRRSAKADATYAGSIPHDTFTDQPRTVSGTVADLDFSETTFAPLLVARYPVTEVIDAIGFIGPVVRSVDVDIFTGATVVETANDSAPQVTPTQQSISKSFVGIQIGVDIRYLLSPRLGAGGFIRYTGGGGDLQSGVSLDPPGVQLGAGLRIRF